MILFFDGKERKEGINADEAITYIAAVYYLGNTILSGNASERTPDPFRNLGCTYCAAIRVDASHVREVDLRAVFIPRSRLGTTDTTPTTARPTAIEVQDQHRSSYPPYYA